MANPHQVTRDFEKALCDYTGAPYAIAVDSCSSALFLALSYVGVKGVRVLIPKHTYPSVPCEIINAGGIVGFRDTEGQPNLRGIYQLYPTPVYDCSLHFTADMYEYFSAGVSDAPMMCLSFTGPHKTLKLGKGGAILVATEGAYNWLKRARYSGRRECSYHQDPMDMIGWNKYMMPEVAARGLLLMGQFYDRHGNKKSNPPLEIPYPDLSKFDVYRKASEYNDFLHNSTKHW